MSLQNFQDGDKSAYNLQSMKNLAFVLQKSKGIDNIKYLLSENGIYEENNYKNLNPNAKNLQDGRDIALPFSTGDQDGVLPDHMAMETMSSTEDYGHNETTANTILNDQSTSELDAKRVEEWLKGKNDGMIFECDEEDMGIFDGDSCEIMSPKMNLSVDEEVTKLALGLPSSPTPSDSETAIDEILIQPKKEKITENYVDILVKTDEGEKFIRVKSTIDFEASLSSNLTNLLSQVSNDNTIQTLVELPEESASDLGKGILPPTYSIPESRYKPKVFKCPLMGCEQIFNKETKLKVHLMSHEETRQFKCTHEGCDWCFTSSHRLKRHLACHNDKKSFVCDEPGCKRKFTTIYNLNTHKSLHNRPSLIACFHPECDERFPTRRQMEFHFKSHTDVLAPYPCPIPSCDKRFFSSNFLSSHLRVHQFSEDDLTCPIVECKKKFERVCQLRQHIKSNHTNERPFACNFEGCMWTFVTASRLNRHMRKHTGERKYVCPEPGCEKSFMRPEHLKGHVIAHTANLNGDKPFKCPVENCDASFTAKSSVYVHLKKHNATELTLYPCPMNGCNRKYRSKPSLKKHLLNGHSTPADSINNLPMVPIVEAMKPPEPYANEIGTLLKNIEAIMPAAKDTNTSSINAQESSLILPEEIMEGDCLEAQPETGESLINSIIEEAASIPSNQSTLDQIISQVSTENEGSSRCTSPEGSLLSRRSSVIGTGSEMDTLILPPLPQVNKGGSARTDFCSNAILSARARKRRLFRQQLENGTTSHDQIELRLKDQLLPAGMLSSNSDVFLASSSISFVDQSGRPPLEHSQLLQDDPPVVHSEIYSDNILDSISTELPNPLLSEPSSSVFPGTVMNLNDLE